MRSRALGVLQLGLNVGVCDVEILCRYFYLLFWGFSCLLSQSIDSCSESLRLESGFGPAYEDGGYYARYGEPQQDPRGTPTVVRAPAAAALAIAGPSAVPSAAEADSSEEAE